MPLDTPNFQDFDVPAGIEDYKYDKQFISRKQKQAIE